MSFLEVWLLGTWYLELAVIGLLGHEGYMIKAPAKPALARPLATGPLLPVPQPARHGPIVGTPDAIRIMFGRASRSICQS
jgi:hypothetical protein